MTTPGLWRPHFFIRESGQRRHWCHPGSTDRHDRRYFGAGVDLLVQHSAVDAMMAFQPVLALAIVAMAVRLLHATSSWR